MKQMVKYFLSAIFVLSFIGSVTASELYPRISGNVIFRLGYDGVYEAQNPLIESNDSFGIMIASPELNFANGFSLNSEIRFETVSPPLEDRFFEGEGLFVRKLFANYDINDRLSVQVGKFTPSFALASFEIIGMYGNNYNKEIELIDRIGLGTEYMFDAGSSGQHKFSASAFFDDTSFLSDSLGSSRGMNSLEDGGASNTESLSSFTLSVEGSKIVPLPGLTYKIGFVHQAKGLDGVSDENGLALAAKRSYQINSDQSLTWVAEVAPIWSFEGTGDDIVYSSAGLIHKSGNWTSVLSGTYRRRDLASGEVFDDYSIQTSLEYDFGDGLSLGLAHEFLRDENIRSQRIGMRLSRKIELGG